MEKKEPTTKDTVMGCGCMLLIAFGLWLWFSSPSNDSPRDVSGEYPKLQLRPEIKSAILYPTPEIYAASLAVMGAGVSARQAGNEVMELGGDLVFDFEEFIPTGRVDDWTETIQVEKRKAFGPGPVGWLPLKLVAWYLEPNGRPVSVQEYEEMVESAAAGAASGARR